MTSPGTVALVGSFSLLARPFGRDHHHGAVGLEDDLLTGAPDQQTGGTAGTSPAQDHKIGPLLPGRCENGMHRFTVDHESAVDDTSDVEWAAPLLLQ